MNRSYAVAAFVLAIALVLGACDDSSDGGSYVSLVSACSQYTSCGTCTPVLGCGWCFNRTGGLCAADPDECAQVQEFTWSWDSAGCPNTGAAVATTVSHDAGATSE